MVFPSPLTTVAAVIALLCLSFRSIGFAVPDFAPVKGSHVNRQTSLKTSGWVDPLGGSSMDAEASNMQANVVKAIGLSAVIGCTMGFSSRASVARRVTTKSPEDTYKVVIKGGEARLEMPPRDIFLQSIVTGFYIGFGGTLCSTVGGSLPGSFPAGMQRFLFGAIGFPLSIFLTTIAGGQGFTPNISVMATALYRKGQTSEIRAGRLWRMLWNLMVAYGGNTVGLLTIAQLANLAHLPAVPAAVEIAKHKLGYSFMQILVRGILGGWLIGLAVWTAQAADSLQSKFVTIWLCISTYVMCQYEHCLANLFFVPCAIFSGANISWEAFILQNLIPATLGNLIGGFGMLAGTKRAVYGRAAFADELAERLENPAAVAAAPDAPYAVTGAPGAPVAAPAAAPAAPAAAPLAPPPRPRMSDAQRRQELVSWAKKIKKEADLLSWAHDSVPAAAQ